MQKKNKDFEETDLKISENKKGKIHRGDIEGMYEAEYESKFEKAEQEADLNITDELHAKAVAHVKEVHDKRGEPDKEVTENIHLDTYSVDKGKKHYGDIDDMSEGNRRGRFDTGEAADTLSNTDEMHDKAINEEVTHQDKYKK